MKKKKLHNKVDTLTNKTYFVKKEIIVSVLLLLFITFIAFYPSLNNGFVNFDDGVYVVKNPIIKNLSLENFKNIFTSFYADFYHPVTLLTLNLEYFFFKLDPFIYHLTNLIFHILNALFVFLIIYLISSNIYISFTTSLLFAIHPLHVESVSWISERKDVLSAFFLLSSLIGYLYYKKTNNIKYYYISIIIFIFSLLSKPAGIVWPFILILFDYLFSRKIDKNSIKDKIPYLLLAVFFTCITFISFSEKISLKSDPLSNMLIACHGVIFYLVKMLIPLNFSCFYPEPGGKLTSYYEYLFSPLAVILLISFVFYSIKFTKKVIFGFLFYFIMLIPVIQIIRNTEVIAADRYTYISSIGIFYLFSEFIYWLSFKKIKNSNIMIIFIVIITLSLSYLTWERCKVWHDSITLWNDVLSKYPHTYKAYYGRGAEYNELGEYGKAINDYNEAIKINPSNSELYSNRGFASFKKGDLNRALDDFNKSIEFNSSSIVAYNNRGNVYLKLGKYDKAIEDFTYSIKLKPDDIQSYLNRAKAYEQMGNYNEALNDYSNALKINQLNFEIYYTRGNFYLNRKEYDKAFDDFNKALNINPDYIDVYNNRAFIYIVREDYKKAIEDYNTALKINPAFYKSYYNRGLTYESIGEYNKAIEDYTRTIELNPSYIAPYINRSVDYFILKDYENSWKDVEIIQKAGQSVDPAFLEKLRKASGRVK